MITLQKEKRFFIPFSSYLCSTSIFFPDFSNDVFFNWCSVCALRNLATNKIEVSFGKKIKCLWNHPRKLNFRFILKIKPTIKVLLGVGVTLLWKERWCSAENWNYYRQQNESNLGMARASFDPYEITFKQKPNKSYRTVTLIAIRMLSMTAFFIFSYLFFFFFNFCLLYPLHTVAP